MEREKNLLMKKDVKKREGKEVKRGEVKKVKIQKIVLQFDLQSKQQQISKNNERNENRIDEKSK